MESDIGNPIEYNPTIIDKDPPEQAAPATELTPEYYYPPAPPPPPMSHYPENTIFSSLDLNYI